MNLAMCEVPVHPVEFLSVAELEALPELPMTQAEDGTWYCDGESTQEATTGAQLFDVDNVIIGYLNDRGILLNDSKYRTSDYIIINSEQSITISCDKNTTSNPWCSVSFYHDDDMIGNSNGYFEAYYTTELPEGTNKIRVGIGTQVGFDGINNIMVNAGSTALPYEPYTGGIPSPNPDYPQPIINTYPAGTYKAICGDKVYKVVLDDDLRSVPGVADRMRIDAGRCVCWVERKVNVVEFDGSEPWVLAGTTGENYQEYALYYSVYNALKEEHKTFCNFFMYDANKGTVNSCRQTSENYCLRFTVSTDITPNQTVDEWKAYLAQKHDSGEPVIFYYAPVPTTHQSVPPLLTTISSGRSLTIPNTVNDAADMLAVKGDSWQLVQEEITDADGNVTQPSMPSPEYPSEIVSVEGEMRSCGWNLVDQDEIEIGGINGANGTIFKATNRIRIGFIPVEEGKVYTLYGNTLYGNTIHTANTHIYDSGKVRIGTFYNGKEIVSVGKFVRVSFKKITDEDFTEEELQELKSTLMFIEGTTPRPYDRHRGNSITLPTLRSLPDGTRDVLHVDRAEKRAWVERCVGVVEFDGSEKFLNKDNVGWQYLLNNIGRLTCSHFKESTSQKKDSNTIRRAAFTTFVFYPDFYDEGIDYWKEWLKSQYDAGTPVTVHYSLATPTIEELPYSDYLLETAQYETNIHIDCDEHLEPEIGATVKVLGR